jgi:hypothetical protein
MIDLNKGIQIKELNPEVMTVSVEIHEKHDGTFFLGSQRYLQWYLSRRRFPSSPPPIASSARKTAASKLPSISHTTKRAMREMRCHGNKPNPQVIETRKFAMD